MSCFLIVTPFEKFIVPVNHNEKFGMIEKIDCSESKVCVGDMKSFLHNSMVEAEEIFGLIDLNWCHYMKTNEHLNLIPLGWKKNPLIYSFGFLYLA